MSCKKCQKPDVAHSTGYTSWRPVVIKAVDALGLSTKMTWLARPESGRNGYNEGLWSSKNWLSLRRQRPFSAIPYYFWWWVAVVFIKRFWLFQELAFFSVEKTFFGHPISLLAYTRNRHVLPLQIRIDFLIIRVDFLVNDNTI